VYINPFVCGLILGILIGVFGMLALSMALGKKA
jgi:hypothetical protein